jgi:hypothetical protein
MVRPLTKVNVQRPRLRKQRLPSTLNNKLAIFYQGGYEAEILLNATGYATSKKWDLIEKQVRHFLPDSALKELETLEFQRYPPSPSPLSFLTNIIRMKNS